MIGFSVKRKLKQLQSDKAQVRADAVTALAELGDPQAVEGLCAILHDEERTLRIAAAQALAAIAHPSAVDPLVAALVAERSWDVRHEIVETLRKIGDPTAVNQLILVLESGKDAAARDLAASALKSVGAGQLSAAQQAQVAIMQDDWATVGRLGVGAIEPLHDALRTGTPRVRRFAAEALVALNDERAMGMLLGCMTSPDVELRLTVARALEDKAWARLAPAHLAQVAVTLGKWPEAVSAGEAAVEPLRGALGAADAAAKPQIIAALAAIGGAAATNALLAAVRHDDVAVRRAAAQALADIHDPAATAALAGAIADDDTEVRCAAAAGLIAAGWQAPDTATRARLLIAAGDSAALAELGDVGATQLVADLQAPGTRAFAVEMLSRLGGAATDALLKALDNVASAVRLQAIEALGVVGDPRAVPHLTGLFDCADAEVCQAARRVLGRLGWQAGSDAERARIDIVCADWEGVAGHGPAAVEPLLERIVKKQSTEAALRALEQFVQGENARQLAPQQLQAIIRATEGRAQPTRSASRVLVAGPALRQAVIARRVGQFARAELQRRGAKA